MTTSQTISYARRAINCQLSSLGFNTAITEAELNDSFESKQWHPIQKYSIIPTENLGVMRHVFTKVTCDINAGIHENNHGVWLKIEIHYHWEHPSGSNGYRIEYVMDPRTAGWNQYS